MRALLILFLFFLSCNPNQVADSTPIYDLDNSTLTIKYGDQFYLKRCQAIIKNDSIFMNFSDTVKHSNWYELQIIKVKNQFLSQLYSTFSVTDSSYKIPIFTVYDQTVKLDKTEYKVNDSIKGTVLLKISSLNRWPEIFTDSLIIEGEFKAIVQ